MQNEQAAEVLRLFEESRALVASGQDRRWRWRPGTLLFPEGRCCYCGGVVRSNRIWVADDGWLRGQMEVSGDNAVWERPNHPHAGTDGGMCLGGTTADLVTILFFAVNPADTLRWHNQPVEAAAGIKAWYAEMFGHVCGADGALKAAEGLFAAVTAVHRARPANCDCGCGCNPEGGNCICGCEECECPQSQCGNCEEATNADNLWTTPEGAEWCEACFSGRWNYCYWCGSTEERDAGTYIAAGTRFYCPQHRAHAPLQATAEVVAAPWATPMPTINTTEMAEFLARYAVTDTATATAVPARPADDPAPAAPPAEPDIPF